MKKLFKGKEISKHNIIKIAVVALLVVAFAYAAFSLASNYVDISKLNNQANQAQQTLDEQNEENEKLKAILDSENKDDYIEEKAREKGYVKNGETVYYDISSSK